MFGRLLCRDYPSYVTYVAGFGQKGFMVWLSRPLIIIQIVIQGDDTSISNILVGKERAP